MKLGIKNLTKKYKDRTVIDNLTFKFSQFGTVCLFGPSGCGKTTLLNCIAGLEPYDSGKILLSSNKISYIFQEDRLLPWISIKENVAAVIHNNACNLFNEAEKWIKLVGLVDDKDSFPGQLSGGMRQRAAIARALAYKGDLFLLDEPFHALDYKSKSEMIKLIKQKTANLPKILVTHDIEEAKMLADVIYILNGPPIKIIDIIKKEQ